MTLTHTGDHIFGLLPLMASIANGAGGTIEDIEDPRAQSRGNVDVEVGLPNVLLRSFQAHRVASHWRYTDHSEHAHTFVRASHIRTLSWELHTSSTSFAFQLIHPTVIGASCHGTRPNCQAVGIYPRLAESGRISSGMLLSASPQPPFCIPCHAWGMLSRKPLFQEK